MRTILPLISLLVATASVTASPADLSLLEHVHNNVRSAAAPEDANDSRQAAAIQLAATMPKCGVCIREGVEEDLPMLML